MITYRITYYPTSGAARTKDFGSIDVANEAGEALSKDMRVPVNVHKLDNGFIIEHVRTHNDFINTRRAASDHKDQ